MPGSWHLPKGRYKQVGQKKGNGRRVITPVDRNKLAKPHLTELGTKLVKPKLTEEEQAKDTKRTDLKPNLVLGDLQLIRKFRAKTGSIATKTRWEVKCTAPNCGKVIVVPQMYLLRKENPKRNCGCRGKSLKTLHNREYRIWFAMRSRTTDPRHQSYPSYGGRGIKMDPEWFDMKDGFEKFIKHVGPSPSLDYSIDRIDNARGYEPGNMRWATLKQQRANQRPRGAVAQDIENTLKTFTIEERWDYDLPYDEREEVKELRELLKQGKVDEYGNRLIDDDADEDIN